LQNKSFKGSQKNLLVNKNQNFMKCPNCGGEMEKGTLSGNGNIWLKPGFRAKILKATYLGLANPYVYAWKCSNCGKIELYAEKKS
jgi:predicted RNA-binding Zn-ribbon protein involved in translation (DUF1610 family)